MIFMVTVPIRNLQRMIMKLRMIADVYYYHDYYLLLLLLNRGIFAHFFFLPYIKFGTFNVNYKCQSGITEFSFAIIIVGHNSKYAKMQYNVNLVTRIGEICL